MRIECLDRAAFEKYAASILNLEAEVVAQTGAVYSDQPWTKDNFLRPLPGKEDFSFLARDEEGTRVLGFLIAHTRYGHVHVSRVAVSPDHQRRGVASALFAALRNKMRDTGMVTITIQLNAGNEAAVRAYERVGLERLSGEGLKQYLAAHNLDGARLFEDRFVDVDGHTYFAYGARLP